MQPITRRRTIALGMGTLAGLSGCSGSEADEDLDVYLDNDHDEERTVLLRITHEGDTIHEERYQSPPGTRSVVYNFQESPVAGAATYDVTAELDDGQTDSVTVRTTSCYGSVVVSVDGDGELRVIYSVC